MKEKAGLFMQQEKHQVIKQAIIEPASSCGQVNAMCTLRAAGRSLLSVLLPV